MDQKRNVLWSYKQYRMTQKTLETHFLTSLSSDTSFTIGKLI
jgi:hypothetical protein